MQAASFVTALKASQGLVKVNDHIKNYRPKIIVLSGDPPSRPNLVDFANLITKKLSLMSTLDIVDDEDWKTVETRKQLGQAWLLSNKIKGFHSVTRNSCFRYSVPHVSQKQSLMLVFSDGVRSALELHGLSKLSPNMLMLGFKEDWLMEGMLEHSVDYYQTLFTAMDMRLAVGILRLPEKYRSSEETETIAEEQW